MGEIYFCRTLGINNDHLSKLKKSRRNWEDDNDFKGSSYELGKS